MPSEPHRNGERVNMPEPLPGSVGDSPAKVVEISTSGCRVEHGLRLPIGGSTRLKFAWNATQVELGAKVAWSELKFAAKEKFYVSGLQFSEPDGEGAQLVRSLLEQHLNKELGKSLPAHGGAFPFFEPAPFLAFGEAMEIELPKAPAPRAPDKSGTFVECRLRDGAWQRREIHVPLQPRDGFTIPAPVSDAEVEEYCRTYEAADDEVRRMIRASIELRINRPDH